MPHVLDLGCGDAACAYAIKQRWPNAHIMGIDLDPMALHLIPPFVQALQADIRALPIIEQPAFNLIIVRHPDVFRRPETWKKVINGVGRLSQINGYLLVTCYSLPEAKLIGTWQPNQSEKNIKLVDFGLSNTYQAG